jgi:hypothetical protein
MNIKDYLKETTTSSSIGNSYEVPYADGNGKFKTKIPPQKRTLSNIPKDEKGLPICKKRD